MEKEGTMMEDRTVTLSKHEAVVDRDWLERIGVLLLEAGHKDLGDECIEISNGPKDEDEGEPDA
jgi:hypothetical protein